MSVTLALGALVGCDSTQSKNARAELVAKRQLGARELPRVKRTNPQVRVTNVAIVRGKRSGAVVVQLRSRASKPLTDVPIEVGVRGPAGREPLNVRRNLDWFQTHVPAIPARGEATWIFEQRRRPVPTGDGYARVGVPSRLSRAGELPELVAAPLPARRPSTRVSVDNPSDVPQYGLQVYALVRRGGSYVAAGKVAVEHLGTGRRTTTSVELIGAPGRRAARVHAVPTIFE